MHQNSIIHRMLTDVEIRALKPRRHARKVSDGGGLYLLVTPKGGRCWRYAYRFARKYKTLSLGMYPDVPLERARSRHEFARNLLAHGLDPAAMKAALGKHAFTITMRTWEIARGRGGAFADTEVDSRIEGRGLMGEWLARHSELELESDKPLSE
jgi:hypothetical protein